MGGAVDLGLYFTKKTLLLKWGHYYPEVSRTRDNHRQ